MSPFEVVSVDGWIDVVIDTRSGLMWTLDANLLRLTPSRNPGGYGLSISDAFVFRNVVNDAENGFVYPSLSGSKAYVWLVRNP